MESAEGALTSLNAFAIAFEAESTDSRRLRTPIAGRTLLRGRPGRLRSAGEKHPAVLADDRNGQQTVGCHACEVRRQRRRGTHDEAPPGRGLVDCSPDERMSSSVNASGTPTVPAGAVRRMSASPPLRTTDRATRTARREDSSARLGVPARIDLERFTSLPLH